MTIPRFVVWSYWVTQLFMVSAPDVFRLLYVWQSRKIIEVLPSSGLSFNPAFSFRRFSVFFYDSGWALVRSLTDATQAHSFGANFGRFEGGDIPLLPSVLGQATDIAVSQCCFFLGAWPFDDKISRQFAIYQEK